MPACSQPYRHEYFGLQLFVPYSPAICMTRMQNRQSRRRKWQPLDDLTWQRQHIDTSCRAIYTTPIPTFFQLLRPNQHHVSILLAKKYVICGSGWFFTWYSANMEPMSDIVILMGTATRRCCCCWLCITEKNPVFVEFNGKQIS